MRPRYFSCFRDEAVAVEFLESLVWPDGVVCPHCGERSHSGRLNGLSTAVGMRKCYKCRKLFSVKASTIFQHSHAPLHKWLYALFLTDCGSRPISPFRLSRQLNVSFKTAAQMLERIAALAEASGLQWFDKPEAIPMAPDALAVDESAARPSPKQAPAENERNDA